MNKTSTSSFEAVQTAIKTLNDKGIKPTQRNVSVESGLSVRSVKTYWARVKDLNDNRVQVSPIEQDIRVQVSNDRVQSSKPSSAFERLKDVIQLKKYCPTNLGLDDSYVHSFHA